MRVDRIDLTFQCGLLTALESARYFGVARISGNREYPEPDQPGGARQGPKKLGIEVPTPGSVEKHGSSGLH